MSMGRLIIRMDAGTHPTVIAFFPLFPVPCSLFPVPSQNKSLRPRKRAKVWT